MALGELGEPGDPRLVSLVAELGATTVRDHLAAERDPGGGVLADVAARLASTDPERDLDRADRLGIRFVIPGDDEWPTQVDQLMTTETLDERGGPPLGLWVRGPMRLDELDASVAVVGSRSATTYGTSVAGEISARVARAGYTVVSGAAFGIDQAAHRGALAAGGRTVAVLACGVDRAYPPPTAPCSTTSATTTAVVSELRARSIADAHPVPQPQPHHRGAHPRHGGGRGSRAQRCAQHRRLGGAAPPAADGSPRPGHRRPVRGRPPAGPQGCREPGHPW